MVYVLLCESILAPIQSEVSAELLIPASGVALISAIYLLANAVAKVPAGLAVGRWGVSVSFPLAILLTGAGLWLFSVARGEGSLIASRCVLGVSASVILPAMAFVARRAFPPDRFVMLMGIAGMTEGAGGILGMVCGNAAENAIGWRQSLQVLTWMAVPAFLLAWAAFPGRRFGPPRGERTDSSLKGLLAPLGGVLGLRQVWLGAAIYALGMGTFCGMGGLWNVRLAEEWGWEEHLAVWIGGGLSLGVMLGSPLFGWLPMRIGVRRCLLGGLGLSLLSLLIWVWVPLEWSFAFDFINTALIGLGLMSVVGAFEIACHGLNEGEVTTATALMNLAALMAGALFEFLPGLIVEFGHGSAFLRLQSAHGIFGVALLLALVLTRQLPSRPSPL